MNFILGMMVEAFVPILICHHMVGVLLCMGRHLQVDGVMGQWVNFHLLPRHHMLTHLGQEGK